MRSEIISTRRVENDTWTLVFNQPHDAFTIQITATLNSKSMERLEKTLKDPTMTGLGEIFLTVANSKLMFAGYFMGGHFMDYNFTNVYAPEKMPIKKIFPCEDGCEIFLHAGEVGTVTYKATGLCFEEMMFELFGKNSQDELTDYFQRNHVVANVYNGTHLYLPVPIPTIEVSAKAIMS